MLTGEPPFKAETVVGVAMKHVNDPMPDTQELRPDASAALARVVERATQKDPDKRYRDMNEMLTDLEAALEVEVARAGGSHGEATTVLDSVPRDRRRILTSRRVSIAGILLVLAATAAALVIAAVTGGGGHHGESGGGGGGGGVPSGQEITITSATAFDPDGTGGEHNDTSSLAIDGDPSDTGWTTESYQVGPDVSLSGKPGVGLILDAGRLVAARTLAVETAESGWSATIYGAQSGPPSGAPPGGGWTALTDSIEVTDRSQAIDLNTTVQSRYYLIWITSLSGHAPSYNVEIDDAKLYE